MTDILTPISPGELLDKLTILEIKLDRIADAAKRANVVAEHAALQAVVRDHIPDRPDVGDLRKQLKTVNETLWKIEDDIRDCERAQDFGPDFIRLARAVYVTNDKRAALKKELNLALGSTLVEEKSYADY